MSKHHHDDDDDDGDHHYARTLRDLQIELVKAQRQLIAHGGRVLLILEGRDGAGKDGAIKRITEHMSPRDTRVHAPGKPSDRETTQWYFQRFVPFLPSAGEFVIFNRSWYNRSGVEQVMGFCSDKQVEEFYESVVPFEDMLVRDGLLIRKYYLDITKKEQKKRLDAREKAPEAVEDLAGGCDGAEEVERLHQGAGRNLLTHRSSRRAVANRRKRHQEDRAAGDHPRSARQL